MVREFISILPDVQRRALAIEGDERAGRRAQERENGTLPNGDGQLDNRPEELTAASKEVDTNGAPSSNTPAQASGTYPTSLGLNSIRDAAGSPAPTPRSRQHSPFTGPPKFASGQPSSPGLLHRVLSGPFALPRQASSSGSPAPRPHRRIIEDDISMDDEGEGPRTPALRTQQPITPVPAVVEQSEPETDRDVDEAESSSQPSHPLQPAQPAQPAQPPPRRSKRVTSAPRQSSVEEPSREPSPPLAQRTRARQSSQTPSAPPGPIPGSFEPLPHPEPVPEDQVLETAPVPPTPSRDVSHPRTTRSRMTRSVSRAFSVDENEEEDNEGTARKKRAKHNTRTREDSVPATPSQARRSTRASTRASSALPSERGSPTPSVASTTTGRVTRRNAGTSGTQTQRQTRSRKQ